MLKDFAISIKNSSFSWGNENIANLKNISLNLKKGELMAIVGPVGAGKSSLISALIGEMNKLSGDINIDGSLAYVPQQAWIQNATLRVSIIASRYK